MHADALSFKRQAWDGFTEPQTPCIKAIGIHRLSKGSHGNGGGMALADIVSRRFYEALDLELTWKHMISCNWTVGGKMPVCAGNDAEVALQPFSADIQLQSIAHSSTVWAALCRAV